MSTGGIDIEWGAHGVLNKNKNYANFFTHGRTTTYRKKSLVVGVPFSHGARCLASLLESAYSGRNLRRESLEVFA
jgi:hypothetical protein